MPLLNCADLLAYADWEGGLYPLIVAHGVDATEYDEDTRAFIQQMLAHGWAFEQVAREVQARGAAQTPQEDEDA